VDITAVLVIIIVVFVICHSFKFAVNCYEAWVVHNNMKLDDAWNQARRRLQYNIFEHLLQSLLDD
jgi:hypothetical protein